MNDAILVFANRIRETRRATGLSQEELADRAGLTRQKIGELERGKPGVAIAAYMAALTALGLEPKIVANGIVPADYPQLRLLAWNRDPERRISEPDALALYERNWHLVDEAKLTEQERELIQGLVQRHGGGILHV